MCYVAQAFAVFSSANFQRSIVSPFRGERVNSLPKGAHTRKGESELFFKKVFYWPEMTLIQCKIAIYFNAEAQGRRVRRGSWSLELELESGGLGVRSQESGVGERS